MKETFVYCHDVAGLLQAISCLYDSTEWRIFIDSSKPSLKCVLLHNGNRYTSIPIGHSVHLKKNYENMNMLPMKIKYSEHIWMVCGDLKYCWVNKGGIHNAHAFCVYGTAELKMNIGFVSNGRKEISLQLEKKIFFMKVS